MRTTVIEHSYSRIPFSSTQTPSVQHISSTQWPHLFSIQNPSVQHQKALSSTSKTAQFNTPLSYFFFLRVVLNGGVFSVELRSLWNWGVSVLNRRVFGLELRDFEGWKEVVLLCGTEVLNWWRCWTEGDPFEPESVFFRQDRRRPTQAILSKHFVLRDSLNCI